MKWESKIMPRRWHLYYAPNKLSSLPSRDRWQGYVYPCSIVVLLLHLVLEEKVSLTYRLSRMLHENVIFRGKWHVSQRGSFIEDTDHLCVFCGRKVSDELISFIGCQLWRKHICRIMIVIQWSDSRSIDFGDAKLRSSLLASKQNLANPSHVMQ